MGIRIPGDQDGFPEGRNSHYGGVAAAGLAAALGSSRRPRRVGAVRVFECILVVVYRAMLGIMAGYGKGSKEKIDDFG